MNATETTTMHKFEAAGLGKAPFKYAGEVHQEMRYGERVIGTAGGIALTTKPGGTCAYCGQYIVAMFNIVSADGKRFHVGSDCVMKVGDRGLVVTVRKAVNARRKEMKDRRDKLAIEEARLRFPAVRDMLATHPHPSEYFAKQGKTLADWVEYMLGNAGTRGKLDAAKMIAARFAVVNHHEG